MDVPLHKYWGDMSPVSHRDRRPSLQIIFTNLHISYLECIVWVCSLTCSYIRGSLSKVLTRCSDSLPIEVTIAWTIGVRLTCTNNRPYV